MKPMRYSRQQFSGPKHLSLEQAERLAKFLGLSENELTYLLTLVQRNRAGSKDLEMYFVRRLEEMREAHLDVTHRLGQKKRIRESDQAVYYSSWHYGAVHAALLVPGLRTVATLARRLALSERKVAEVLEFLCSIGVVKLDKNNFQTTANWVRLGKSSPLIAQHHTNVRLKAIDAIHEGRPDELHYSGYFSLSRQDAALIRDQWLKTLAETQSLITKSPAEEAFGICIDVFEL